MLHIVSYDKTSDILANRKVGSYISTLFGVLNFTHWTPLTGLMIDLNFASKNVKCFKFVFN